MTPAQLTILKNAIAADPTMSAFPNTMDGAFDLANYLNAASSPAVNVWRADVGIDEIGPQIVMSEYVALTAVKQTGLLQLTQGAKVDATNANVRQAFSAIFGAGATSLTNLTALAQRAGTRFETIAGFLTAAAPANVSSVYGIRVTYLDVMAARNA